MNVSLIAALANHRLIGSTSGRIPWSIPRDRAHFRAYTAGKWVLVGRKTYGEMDGWFTTQTPLILSGDPGFKPRHPAHRLVASPAIAVDLARGNGAVELVICGGASVYAGTIGLANRLVITRIRAEIEVADPVFFPDFEQSDEWKSRYAESWPCDAENPFAMRLEIFERTERGESSPKNNRSPF